MIHGAKVNTKEISILIVDDEEPIRKLLVGCLGRKYLCITASSADEAARLLAVGSTNLVLTDISMPGISGLELCESIQRGHPETVVVMMSGNNEIQYAIE